MKTIIYDSNVAGHHLTYIAILVDYLLEQPVATSEKYVFVLNYQAKERFEYASDKLQFVFTEKEKIDSFFSQSNSFKRAKLEFDYLKQFLAQFPSSRLVLMSIDMFQFELWKNRKQPYLNEVSGILFMPFRKEYENQNGLKAKFSTFIKGIRKNLQLRLMLANRSVKSVFILNDERCVEELNKKYKQRFALLPDPPPIKLPSQPPSTNINSSESILLVYGSISGRKNVENIIKALVLLPVEIQKKVTLHICGQPMPDYSGQLNELIESARLNCPAVRIISQPYFFNDVATTEIFRKTAIVLSPYINFYNSSSVVALSAIFNVPIIISKATVAGEIVEKYKLGLSVSPHVPAEIACAIEKILNGKTTVDGQNYLYDFSSEKFCHTILF